MEKPPFRRSAVKFNDLYHVTPTCTKMLVVVSSERLPQHFLREPRDTYYKIFPLGKRQIFILILPHHLFVLRFVSILGNRYRNSIGFV